MKYLILGAGKTAIECIKTLIKLNNESETIDIFKSSVKDNLFEQLRKESAV